MKEVTRLANIEIRLPLIRIDILNFLNILLKYDNNDSIKIEIGNHHTDGGYILEGKEETLSNVALIHLPIKANVSGVTIELTGEIFLSSSISFPERSKSIGSQIYIDLKQYRAWYNLLLSDWSVLLFPAILANLTIMITNKIFFTEYHNGTEYIFIIIMFLLYATIFHFVKKLALRSTVFYSSRETFWKRNKDKIVVASIMLFFGAMLRELLDLFFPNN